MNAAVGLSRPEPLARAIAFNANLKVAALLAGAILLLFHRDVADMAATWWAISTYNHCLLILPIIGWLVWQRSDALAKLPTRGWWVGLPWIACAACGWLLGEAAGVSFARQLGVVMMLQGVVIAVLGPAWTRALIFPLFYAFFLVPFGEETIPFLQTITADMSMWMLGLTDIPAYIDGVFISTPTGYFEVAEACSGVKFLIAMIAYGALVSNLCFSSWRRRAAFMAACVAVPIVANGIRAFGTIYIAHHTTSDFATGFDHIFYGWFFFAFVLALVMALGWPFFDRSIDTPAVDVEQARAVAARWPASPLPRTAAIAALLMAAPVTWTAAVSLQPTGVPAAVALPQVPGWTQIDETARVPWRPRFDGADHLLTGRYRHDGSGAVVDLGIAVFGSQGKGRELVGYGQGAQDPDSDWAWSRDLPALDNALAKARGVQLAAPGPVLRDVYTVYRIDGQTTGQPATVKLATLKQRLLGGDQRAAAVLISAERNDRHDVRAAIGDFARALGAIDAVADRAMGIE